MDKKLNIPQVGMKLKHPSMLKESEFSLLINGNIQGVSGNTAIITNDHSNILASKFKEGFKVINATYVPSLSLTFFFLANPKTKESEIGFIFDTSNTEAQDITAPCSDCDNPIVESTPLELTNQLPKSVYNTFVNADCLKFDIDHPITCWVKIDDCNVRIYFNDFNNPPRYIDYKNFPKVDLSNCPLIETDQLDCDKINIFPQTCYPSTNVVEVVSGGQNLAGVYQFTVCYADVRGNKLTDYFYVTNPIPLGNQAITIDTAYPVYKSFKLEINNLNTDFKYLNLAVLKTIHGVTTPYLIDTFEVNSSNFQYIYTGVDKNLTTDLTIGDIIGKSPYYNKARLTSESNGYLFMTSVEEDRVLSLQPVVNKIKPLWQNVKALEGDYANPVFAQDYVGYLGDEVYAFGIAFTKTTGKATNIFPFIGRDFTESDMEVIDNDDVIKPATCATDSPNKRWQVYNTASVIGYANCITFDTFLDPVDITVDIDCNSETLLIQTIDTNGNLLPAPIFWKLVPSGTTCGSPARPVSYPPQTSQQTLDLWNCYLSPHAADLANIATDHSVQTEVGLCDCDFSNPKFKPYYDQDSSATIVAIPIDIDLTNTNNDIQISAEDTIYNVNTYGGTQDPPSAGKYPYKPTPCKKDGTDEDGYETWLSQKTNWTASSADLISQSSNSSCAVETWGSFIAPPTQADDTPSQSWYTFYCTNQDGVAAITLSTQNGNYAPYTITLYPSDQNGNIIVGSPIAPSAINVTSEGSYELYEGLTQGALYFIKIEGHYPYPTLASGYVLPKKCIQSSFKLCVVSPNPLTTTKYVIPGLAILTKTCEVTYKGYPENHCKPSPYKYGEFAYWESTETYPCNEEVWGSLAGKPIRHFKFPDQTIVPFFDETNSVLNNLTTNTNNIYPKGIVVKVSEIKLALQQAVAQGLISEEEKNQICGYRIYRSNRRGNQSIIAKGLLYDVWKYKDNIYNTGNDILFPNFPFNDREDNIFIKNKKITRYNQAQDQNFLPHPYKGLSYQNNKYTLDAPNLSFNNPGLGTELKLECEQYGKAVGNYIELKNNAKYQYVGAGIISAAIGFASVEAAFEALNTMVNATLTTPITVFGSGTAIPLGLILAVVGENLISPVRMYSHYGEWYDLIKKFAPYRNFGLYYTGVGKYLGNSPVFEGNIRRTIANAQYIKPGILNVKTTQGSTRFNNFKRDSSVFLELDSNQFFNATTKVDNSRSDIPCNTVGVTGDIASYYASLKNPIVNQYSQIDNIEWIDTGYNGRIDWSNPSQDTSCDTIFGGDTYITRFTKKRKVPMFLEDRVLPTSSTQSNLLNTDIQMSLLPNIGYPRYFMDYPNTLDYNGVTQALFGDVAVLNNNRADYNLACFKSEGEAWASAGLGAAILGSFSAISFGIVSLPIAVGIISGGVKKDLGNTVYINGKYLHSMYGITSFLCESDYNLSLRHGENIKEKDFYPNVGDINEWTQECFIPISEDNYYIYNNDYSKQNKENPNYTLNNDYSKAKDDCKVSHPNRLIYSLQDTDQDDRYDGNLVFLSSNRYDFPKSLGKPQIVTGLSNGRILIVLENGWNLANSYISQKTNIGTDTIGSNSLFNESIPIQSIKTDLGFAGSQVPAFANTEYGCFWVDNKRGMVIQFTENAKNIVDPEEEWWFKQNLPFSILKDFPDFDITNNYKYVGMAITYDAKHKRIFFTKRDFELKSKYRGLVTYDGTFFNYNNKQYTIEDRELFCNKSWTLSYSPVFQSFISWHTFYPNYYTPNQAYFSSGVNYATDNTELGLWYHNLTNRSFQVYYGKLKAFAFEYAIPTNYQNSILESVQYISEFYRFEDNLSSYLVGDKTYNKAILYNQKQTSGLLELVPKIKNDRRQYIQYPKQNPNSREILTERVNNIWSFNNFYDVSVQNGQPLMTYTCDTIAYKDLNLQAINYKTPYLKNLLRSDYHQIRLINDKYSNYSILHRFSIEQTENSNP